MITVDVPGLTTLALEHVVLDVNGTIAVDGTLLEGVAEGVAALADDVAVWMITADTHGVAARDAASLGISLKIIERGGEDAQKTEFVRGLGAGAVVAIGNGANDAGMLAEAAVGVCVVGREGAAGLAVAAADVVVTSIEDALGLLAHPQRLVATLRR